MLTPHHVSRVMCHMSPITCHLSFVTCQLSPVACHMFCFFYKKKKNLQSAGASQWRVCYQQGLPCLAQINIKIQYECLKKCVMILLSQVNYQKVLYFCSIESSTQKCDMTISPSVSDMCIEADQTVQLQKIPKSVPALTSKYQIKRQTSAGRSLLEGHQH